MTDDQLPPGPYREIGSIVLDANGHIVAMPIYESVADLIIDARAERDETPLTEEFVTALLGERRTFECLTESLGRWPLEVTLNRINDVYVLDLFDSDAVSIPIRTNGELLTWCRQLKIPTTKGEAQ